MDNFQKQFVLALLGYCVQRDIDPQRLCSLSSIDYNYIADNKNATLTAEQIDCLWRNASHLSSDSQFGLHFGESMQLAALGVIGQIVQTSPTVGHALTNACALIGLITDMFQMNLHHEEASFKIAILSDRDRRVKFPDTYRHMADYLMVFVVHELNGLLLKKTSPASVTFPYTLNDVTEYSRLFGCVPVKGDELSLVFSSEFLELPILSANYELQNHLLKRIEALKKNEGKAGILHTKVYNYLLSNSYLDVLSLEAVASNFGMSARSLQRKLRDEGVTYVSIVEEVRKKLAINYLTAAHYSVKDVTHILGYNEQSAFIRAFKRWTKMTPMEYVGSGR